VSHAGQDRTLPNGRIGVPVEEKVPIVATPDVRTRGARLPRTARRAQLLQAAREVFVVRGYHAAGMDEIADRAGVSKPVLYQHFPGKYELYLALIDEHAAEMIDGVRAALASTRDNKQRVAATIAAFFAFIDREGESYRLIFESDFTSDPGVRQRVERVHQDCAAAIAEVITEDAGLPAEQADLLGYALGGMSHVAARYWLRTGRGIAREDAVRLMTQLCWRGIRGFPLGAPGAAGPGALG
jgi:AcrR family transcriptional regulator